MQALVVGPKVSVAPPPPEQYLIHFPKHLGCAACVDCNVQRKHCRYQAKARQRRRTQIIKVDTSTVDDEIDEVDAPKNFGDLVTSDSIFTIKRDASSTVRGSDTTALVVRDRATGWIATYPAKKKSAEEIKSAVNDFKGAETIRRWYSDGAPELHAVCRELCI